jgi:hypothetical protein
MHNLVQHRYLLNIPPNEQIPRFQPRFAAATPIRKYYGLKSNVNLLLCLLMGIN